MVQNCSKFKYEYESNNEFSCKCAFNNMIHEIREKLNLFGLKSKNHIINLDSTTDTSNDYQENYKRCLDKLMNYHINPEINNQPNEDPFYVVDLACIVRKLIHQKLLFPYIKPYYAVKCNPNSTILQLLAELGIGFDCASKGEISKILDTGIVSPNNIVYANPCKSPRDILYALKNRVILTTFDSSEELYKIKDVLTSLNLPFNSMELMLRIKPEPQTQLNLNSQSNARVLLSKKFGASLEEAQNLIKLVLKLNLNLVGISFHVGSGCTNENAYGQALENTRKVFDMASDARIAHNIKIIDIGGGFPGGNFTGCSSFDSSSEQLNFSFNSIECITIQKIADVINPAIKRFFPKNNDRFKHLQFIAEPGRYFVEASHTLATRIISRKIKCFSQQFLINSENKQTQTQHTKVFDFEQQNIEKTFKNSDLIYNSKMTLMKNKNSLICPNNFSIINIDYFINEGVYGSFKDSVLLKENFVPRILPNKQHQFKSYDEQFYGNLITKIPNEFSKTFNEESCLEKFLSQFSSENDDWMLENNLQHLSRQIFTFRSKISGPTGDSADCIHNNFKLDKVLNVGTQLSFSNMGAYTISLSSCHYGKRRPEIIYAWIDLGDYCQCCSFQNKDFLCNCNN